MVGYAVGIGSVALLVFVVVFVAAWLYVWYIR